MNRMLSAERNRRAVITESEGTRQSTINVAEGDKQSNILRAEGERQAAILRAEGFSQALERIFAAAHVVDEKTMSLQYLEALKALGQGQSTKFIIPLEFTELLRPLTGYLDRGMAPSDGGQPARSGGATGSSGASPGSSGTTSSGPSPRPGSPGTTRT
jgi:regulator of protease activity HflC (stomatin/prohibitin superfamily)